MVGRHPLNAKIPSDQGQGFADLDDEELVFALHGAGNGSVASGAFTFEIDLRSQLFGVLNDFAQSGGNTAHAGKYELA